MWSRHKSRNRRLGRQYVLDVKLRSSRVRSARLRLAALSVTVVFALVAGVFLAWRGGNWALDQLVYQNKAFAIDSIQIQTDGVLAPDQLRRWAGVRRGQNLLALDLGRVKRDLELVSVIKQASVERILPHTLRIVVSERDPIAQINFARPGPRGGLVSSTLYVDDAGYIMLPVRPQERAVPLAQPPDPLPLLTGLDFNSLQVGHPLEGPQAQAALNLVSAFERCSMAALVELKSIDLSTPNVLVATTTQGSIVTFGLTNADQQLWNWRAIYDTGRDHGLAIATLDLAVTNSIPARWLQASALPPAPVKRHKAPRKHHV
jgi:POTRA domain, FtsQ-type